MKNNTSLINASLLGVMLVSVFVLIGTIVGELLVVDGAKIFKDLLKDAHHHHWIGKGVWSAIIFFVTIGASYPLFKKMGDKYTNKMPIITVYVITAASVLLTVFFIYEYSIHH